MNWVEQGFFISAFTLAICVVAAIVNQWRGADRE